MLNKLEQIPVDPILGIIQAHKNDPNPKKIDLGVGVYKNEGGHTPILKAVKKELGGEARHLNFNAYADNRSIFRYDMHTLPNEVDSSIGTSTLFAAWNAAIYVAQVEEDRVEQATLDGRYVDATRAVLRERGGLWFHDESYVISRRRD